MKVLKGLGYLLTVYVVFVVLFEAVFLGWYQPSFEDPGGVSGCDGWERVKAGLWNPHDSAHNA